MTQWISAREARVLPCSTLMLCYVVSVTGLSQMQLHKSLEQYQKIPKPVVQHKNRVAMTNFKNRAKHDLQNKLK